MRLVKFLGRKIDKTMFLKRFLIRILGNFPGVYSRLRIEIRGGSVPFGGKTIDVLSQEGRMIYHEFKATMNAVRSKKIKEKVR